MTLKVEVDVDKVYSKAIKQVFGKTLNKKQLREATANIQEANHKLVDTGRDQQIIDTVEGLLVQSVSLGIQKTALKEHIGGE